ncbi:MAG: hypothetical protein JWL80_507 [Parcubacteria group bacterium]|nr:hypothetical protein [Parcubacteria group bacterium]
MVWEIVECHSDHSHTADVAVVERVRHLLVFPFLDERIQDEPAAVQVETWSCNRGLDWSVAPNEDVPRHALIQFAGGWDCVVETDLDAPGLAARLLLLGLLGIADEGIEEFLALFESDFQLVILVDEHDLAVLAMRAVEAEAVVTKHALEVDHVDGVVQANETHGISPI